MNWIDRLQALAFRLYGTAVVFWLAGAALWHAGAVTEGEWFIQIMAMCIGGGTLVFMPLLWIAPTVDCVREYRALNRRIDQRVREAMAADCD